MPVPGAGPVFVFDASMLAGRQDDSAVVRDKISDELTAVGTFKECLMFMRDYQRRR